MPIRAPRRQNCAGQFGQADEPDFKSFINLGQFVFHVRFGFLHTPQPSELQNLLHKNKTRFPTDKASCGKYAVFVSATEKNKGTTGLTESQRLRALELHTQIQALQRELESILGKTAPMTAGVDLSARGMSQEHAAELRARLKTFAEDWERPEAAIYDEDAAR